MDKPAAISNWRLDVKKTLISLAVVAAAGAASAQSNVTVYGMVDAAVTRISQGGSSQNLLIDGGSDTSRLGFRGSEDLGGGLKAKFEIETGLDLTKPGATTLGSRQAWVGLTGEGWGEVRLGRDLNGGFLNSVVFSPWIANGVGQNIALTTRLLENLEDGRDFTRNNNAITYLLPGNLGGVYGMAQYAFDEKATSKSGQSLNFRLGYAAGALNVALGYEDYQGDESGVTTVRDMKSVNLGGAYDLGFVKVMGVWSKDDYKNAATGQALQSLKNLEVSAVMPTASGHIRASYGRAEFDDLLPGANPKASKFAIGYVHTLSKRTSVYTSVARVSNKNGASVGVHYDAPQPDANRSSSGIDFGILHTF